MRRRVWGLMVGGLFLLQGGLVMAQSSLDTLDQELKEAQEHHDEVTSQTLSTFFGQVDAGMASPDVALALYQKAGGTMPPGSPVITTHTDETATEKQARLAIDQANAAKLGAALQLHCGLLHYGALFIVKPDQKGLQEEWVSWLKAAATIYPAMGATPDTQSQNPGHHHRNSNGKGDGKGNGDNAQAASPPYTPAEVKGKSLHDSIISKFLAFNIWGEKDQGKWTVQQLPTLYRSNVLDPSRTPPTAATLANWDAYIAMLNVDVTDNDQWNQTVYPPLLFERSCDDYTIAPDTEKLEGLVNLIKANPSYPNVKEWITRVKSLLASYRAGHGGGGAASATPVPVPPANAPPADPNVTVTTKQEGDMTIVITHTNAAPVNPTAPQ